jgi:hypothetical protein
MVTNLPNIAYYYGMQGIAGDLMEPRPGSVTGYIVGINKFIEDGRRKITMSIKSTEDSRNQENDHTIDTAEIRFYVRDKTISPFRVSTGNLGCAVSRQSTPKQGMTRF